MTLEGREAFIADRRVDLLFGTEPSEITTDLNQTIFICETYQNSFDGIGEYDRFTEHLLPLEQEQLKITLLALIEYCRKHTNSEAPLWLDIDELETRATTIIESMSLGPPQPERIQ